MILSMLLALQVSVADERDAVRNSANNRKAQLSAQQLEVQKINNKPPSPTEVRLNQCLDISVENAAKGVSFANEWKFNGGGFFADHCLGFAYSLDNKFNAAMGAFDKAATSAVNAGDSRAPRFWLQAANAAIAAFKPDKAVEYVDSALASGALEGVPLGEAHLDKARALVALKQEEKAGAELLLAQKYVPKDPLVWLLSATLSRRLGKIDQARQEITEAALLVPRDPSVALEQGNIEAEAGNYDAAEKFWRNVLSVTRDGSTAQTAQSLLNQLEQNRQAAKTDTQ